MTTFATNVGTPAAAMATAAATAMADLDVLRTNFAPNFPGTTLGNLGGSHASALQSAMGNLRNDLDAAELEFSTANQRIQRIGAAIAALAALD